MAEENIETRPLPDFFRALNEVCEAVLDSRCSIITKVKWLKLTGEMEITNRIVFDKLTEGQ